MLGFEQADPMRQLDDAVEEAIRRHEQFTAANREIDDITVTERSPDGAVSVTVRSSGAVVDLSCSEQIRAMPPRQVAATVLACVQAAQAGIARRVEEVLARTVPGDPLTDTLVAEAHDAFPPAPPPPVPAAAPANGPRHLAIGGIEDDGPRPQVRRRPARSRPTDDDPDDWGGRSVMS